MTTIQEEIDWERKMIDRGIERFIAARDRAITGGRVTETTAGQRLLKQYLDQVSTALDDFYAQGKRAVPEMKIVRSMDRYVVGYIALKAMLGCVYRTDYTYSQVCEEIGSKVEDEFHFMRLETEHKEYLDAAMRIIAEKQTSNYSYLRTSLLQAAKNNVGFKPDYWTRTQRVAVGLAIAQIVRGGCDLFELRSGEVKNGWSTGKATKYLMPTNECLSWVSEHDEAMAMLFPDRMPMLIPPDDWTSPSDGGYVMPKLRHTTPLIIKSRMNPQAGLRRFFEADMPDYYAGVNRIQRTPWRINKRVLAVMQDVWYNNLGVGMPMAQPYEVPPCPLAAGAKPETEEEAEAFARWKSEARQIHALEAERSALCMLVQRNMRIAQELKDKKEFYYVYRADFRGRVYASTTGVSPQGPDQSKALLEFGTAKPLGENGLYWLKVHAANKYGNDKCSYDERVAWVDANAGMFDHIAGDPIGSRELWGCADKPYQFLAAVFELADARRIGPAFVSRLPVALDGSCNGLQHFSAMLRDEVGGASVNLVPQDKPADIYQDVAGVCSMKLRDIALGGGEDAAGAANWLKLFKRVDPAKPYMGRKWAKAPVMTLPYGSTMQTCTDSIYTVYRELGGKFFGNAGFRHAIYLSPILWSSIGEVVIAARAAMDWIQKVSGDVAKSNVHIDYKTPLGFPIHQVAFMSEIKVVATAINGRIQLSINTYTDKPNVRKVKQGSSPNFVHGIDASHMLMTVNAAADEGISDFAMIHDDFGVHACHVERFHGIIREQFVRLHSRPLLDDLYDQMQAQMPDGVALRPPPPCGALRLEGVLDSKYFFG